MDNIVKQFQSFLNVRALFYNDEKKGLFWVVMFLTNMLIGGSIWFETYYPLTILGTLLMGYWLVMDIKSIWWLLLFMIPVSVEYSIGSLGIDLPDEPLMIALTVVFILLSLFKKNIGLSRETNLITLMILIHLAWVLICTLFSQNWVHSIKWSLAKVWYVVPFFFMAKRYIVDRRTFEKMVWVVALPLTFAVIVTLIRHAQIGFSFSGVNKVMKPFFRNHVNYASILVIVLPFVWYLGYELRRWSAKWWINILMIILLLVAVQFSYTRAAYVCLAAAVATYFVIKLHLSRLSIAVAVTALVTGVIFFTANNRYMDYKPEFKKAVTHYKFDNLISATVKGEDVSTVERLYRWLAGYYMVREKPVFGFGPGNFYFYYKFYQVTAFQTYISDNKEKSLVHSYYLLLAIEQGLIGLLIFMLILVFSVLKGEKNYHLLKNQSQKNMVLASVMSIVIISCLNIVNDLTEADKTGPFLFISLAIIANSDNWLKSETDLLKIGKPI